MMFLYVLKGLGLVAATAAAELWASGQCFLAVGAVPMLGSMWYATRLYARRRTRGDPA